MLVAPDVLAALDPGGDRIESLHGALFAFRRPAFELADRGVEQFLGAPRIFWRRAANRRARAQALSGHFLSVSARPSEIGFLWARQCGQAIANGVEPAVLVQIFWVDALFGGLVGDDLVEPLAQAHSGASRGFLRGVARLATDPSDAPRGGFVHWRNRGRRFRIEAPSARLAPRSGCFGRRGEEFVNGAPK